MPDVLSRLLHQLGVDGTADLDATALAEALWLAATLRTERDAPPPDTERPAPRPGTTADPTHHPPQDPAAAASPRSGAAVHERRPGSSGAVPGEPVGVAAGRALPRALDLSRALRAYKRPWPAGLRTELDIDRTIDAYARSGELVPAFRAAPERWFDLLLIVDRSLSMRVWQDTVTELERVLDHLGAFRRLRTWGLTFEDARPVLHDHQGAVVGPDHVLSPQGRRLVLVVSDCASPGWYRPEVWHRLRTWAQSTPVALLDPLPPKLWRRTALDLPGVTATQAVPGNASTTLGFAVPPLLDDPGHDPQWWTPLPILSLSPHSLGRWARTQMRGDPGGCDAVLVPPTGRVPRGRPRHTPTPRIDPVRAFVRTASPEATRLALLCALIGRVGLPVLQLVRQELVPEATVADVAELITSDLVTLHPQDDGTFVITFREGTEEPLRRLLPQHQAWRLCALLEKHVGTSGVPAVLHDPDALRLLPAEARPFGQAARDALRALGVEGGVPGVEEMVQAIESATARLAGEGDVDGIARALYDAAVPAFADDVVLCVHDRLPADENVLLARVLSLFHQSDDFPQFAAAQPDSALTRVMSTSDPLFADSPSGVQALRDLFGPGRPTAGGKRALLAPLHTKHHVVGLAVFLRGESRAPFRTDDLSTAARLAAPTAVGVHVTTLPLPEAARVLQRGAMPPRLPQTSGVDLAARYLPATGAAEVGGDWYDAIPLPRGRVGLVVGDVAGRSMGAVMAMGQLRAAVRTLAAMDLTPHELLRHLDTLASHIEPDRMATCLYAVCDPATRRLSIAAAGHVPPILLEPDGRAGILDVPTGPPLGVDGVVPEAVEVEAPAGSTLVLYTDGLVESRTRDVSLSLRLLCETLGGTGPHVPSSLEALCDEALSALPAGDRDDDVALLAARFPGPAADRVAQRELSGGDLRAPARARQMVRTALENWGLEELEVPMLLLVTELVTNAVIFAPGRLTLRLVYTDVLRCEVGDGLRKPPRLKKEGGKGLHLVEKLSGAVGQPPGRHRQGGVVRVRPPRGHAPLNGPWRRARAASSTTAPASTASAGESSFHCCQYSGTSTGRSGASWTRRPASSRGRAWDSGTMPQPRPAATASAKPSEVGT
ncbi:hypothetical protein RKD23_006926 [Streptomyces sp. SAI-170]